MFTSFLTTCVIWSTAATNAAVTRYLGRGGEERAAFPSPASLGGANYPGDLQQHCNSLSLSLSLRPFACPLSAPGRRRLPKPEMGLGETIATLNWQQESYPAYRDFAVLPFLVAFFPTVRFLMDVYIFEVIYPRPLHLRQRDGSPGQIEPDGSQVRRIIQCRTSSSPRTRCISLQLSVGTLKRRWCIYVFGSRRFRTWSAMGFIFPRNILIWCTFIRRNSVFIFLMQTSWERFLFA